MKRITDDMLTGACASQRALFRKTWPKGATLTKANALKAAKLGLDPDWAAERLLSSALYADYEAKCKPLNADYEAKCWLALLPLLKRKEGGA